MTSINDDIEWLLVATDRLIAINERIGRMVPANPSRDDNMLIAHVFSAKAVSGCEETVRYLRASIKQAMGK